MINVEIVKVNVCMPSDEVRVVAMQPYIQFHSDPNTPPKEPFRWSDAAMSEQLSAINKTLEIAQNSFADQGANFILFPEYSIPGLDGVSIVNDRISEASWPTDCIIIAGIHGITKAEYSDLCYMIGANVSQANAPSSVPHEQWVNCSVVWIKDGDGVVMSWVQPKVRPAWSEMNVTCSEMFRGSTVYVFEGRYIPSGFPFRFVTFICFDWVASQLGTTVQQEVLAELNQMSTEAQPVLDWVFVIQHNTKPNSHLFLNSTYEFLTEPLYPFVQRDKAIVIHVNTAVQKQPSRSGEGGYSACIFSPSDLFDCNCCRPTINTQPGTLRGSDILKRCKDVVFREMGECIHAFSIRVPRFVTPDATDRTYPLPMASVYAIQRQGSHDPRLCGGAIPAAIKWINDSLDCSRFMSTTVLAAHPLKAIAETIEHSIVADMRAINGHRVTTYVNLATCSFSDMIELRDIRRRENADLWSDSETDALEHILYVLTAIGLAYSLEIVNATLHGLIKTNSNNYVQVIAIRGDTYEDCRYHYDNFVQHQGPDPVIVIARDRDNFLPTPEEFLKLDESGGERGLAFLDYQTLVNNCRSVKDTDSLREKFNVILPEDHRII